MPMGRIFSRRLLLETSGLKSLFSHILMSYNLKEDLLVWFKFFDMYTSRSLFQEEFLLAEDLELSTDVADSQGFGAVWHTHWCNGRWPKAWIDKRATKSIVLLVLFSVLTVFKF